MKKGILSLLMLGLVFLVGCFGLTEKEEDLQKKVDELEKQVIEQEMKEEVEEKKPVTINVIDPLTNNVIKTFLPEEMSFETDRDTLKQELEKWAKELAQGSEAVPGYDQRMTLDKIDANGQVIKGTPLVVLKESELVDKVLALLSSGGDLELPLYVTESGYEPEDIPHLDEVVIGSYTTYFASSNVGRNKNIELSALALNNLIIGTGDHFSFNTTVGPRTVETGYQPAPEIVNKKLVMGIGGGICQTSSTLFNAVDQVGVKYIEKHHHSLSVGYVPAGRDATVSYGTLDFRFQNTSEIPFLIKTIYKNDSLTVEVRTSKAYEAILKNT